MKGSNNFTLVGNIGLDLDTFTFDNGNSVTRTTICHNEKYKDKNGEFQERPNWFDVEFFGSQSIMAQRQLKKGSSVSISGELKMDTWKNDGGHKMSAVKLVVHYFREVKPYTPKE